MTPAPQGRALTAGSDLPMVAGLELSAITTFEKENSMQPQLGTGHLGVMILAGFTAFLLYGSLMKERVRVARGVRMSESEFHHWKWMWYHRCYVVTLVVVLFVGVFSTPA